MPSIERDLLFGVLAIQNLVINQEQLIEAGRRLGENPDRSLADLLQERGGLEPDDRAEIERRIAKVLKKHGGDARLSLAAAAGLEARDLLRSIPQPDVRRSVVSLPPPNPGPLPPTVLPTPIEPTDSRYSFLKLHAEGGLGQVLVARDNSLNRKVAIKEIKADLRDRDDVRGRFLKEAQITGQLEHPNIVPVYELARRSEDNQPFYAMRFVQGRSMDRAIVDYHRQRQTGQDNPVEFQGLLNAFVSVCNAIAYAHSRGVIHRDLKPANIVLGDYGEVVVLDWGLAKLLNQVDAGAPTVVDSKTDDLTLTPEANSSETAGVSGTPCYMAPEQVNNRKDGIGERTDVYGLGAILFEILCGRPPFLGPNIPDIYRQITEETVSPHARSVQPHIPKVLDAICARAMAKAPDDRYRSAAELGEEVRRWLADEPVQAAPDPFGVKVRRWIKRHPAAAASWVTAVCLIVVALGGLNAIQNQHNKEVTQAKQLAEDELDLAMASMKAFHGAVTEDSALNNEGLRSLRFRLLAIPQGFYEKLLDRLKAADADTPRNRALLAGTMFELGYINNAKGSAEASIANYRQALKVLEELVAADPSIPQYRKALADSHNNLGLVYEATNRMEDAEKAYSQSLKLREELAAAYPAVVEHRDHLAVCWNNLALIYKATNRMGDAEKAHRQALKIFEELVAANPSVAGYRSHLAMSWNNLALIYKATNRLDDAAKAHHQALKLRKELVDANPSIPQYRDALANSYNNLGELYRTTGKTDDAETFHSQALKIFEELAAANPSVAQHRNDLANSYNNLGLVYEATNRMKDAEKAHRQALKIFEELAAANPSVALYRNDLANSHNNLALIYKAANRQDDSEKSHLQALRLREELVAANPSIAEYRDALAASRNNLALIYKATNRWNDAEKANHQALKLREELIAANPSVAEYRNHLAASHVNLGELYRATGRIDDAEKSYRQALKIFETLAGPNPSVASYAADTAKCYLGLGILFMDTRPQESKSHFDRAEFLLKNVMRDNPTLVEPRNLLSIAFYLRAQIFAKPGQHPQALNDLDQAFRFDDGSFLQRIRSLHTASLKGASRQIQDLIRSNRSADAIHEAEALSRLRLLDAEPVYSLAANIAQASSAILDDASLPEAERRRLSEWSAAQATVWLRQLADEGYFRVPRRVERVRAARVFDSLRKRADFIGLVGDLMFPADPFAQP